MYFAGTSARFKEDLPRLRRQCTHDVGECIQPDDLPQVATTNQLQPGQCTNIAPQAYLRAPKSSINPSIKSWEEKQAGQSWSKVTMTFGGVIYCHRISRSIYSVNSDDSASHDSEEELDALELEQNWFRNYFWGVRGKETSVLPCAGSDFSSSLTVPFVRHLNIPKSEALLSFFYYPSFNMLSANWQCNHC